MTRGMRGPVSRVSAGLAWQNPPREVLSYAAAHGTTMAVAAALLGSACPLVVYAATFGRRMQRLDVSAPGPLMSLAGDVLAAGSVGVSALLVLLATAVLLPTSTPAPGL